jgi:acetyl esterase
MFNALKVSLFRWFYRFMNRRAWKAVDLSAVQVGELVAGKVPARSYAGGEAALVVYIHGGGWTIGDLETHDFFCRKLATDTHSTVVALDYRLGPEHPFPAAPEDCLAATRWLLELPRFTALANAPVFVAGDSAGGNLAAVVANTLATEQPGRLSGQLLIYPAVRHCTPPTASMVENGKGHVLTYGLMEWFWMNYLGEKRSTRDGDIDPLATPLLHPLPQGLAPALVITAGLDPLRDEGAEYAQKLSDHGVETIHELFVNEEHGFLCSEGPTEAHQQAMALIRGWMQSQARP